MTEQEEELHLLELYPMYIPPHKRRIAVQQPEELEASPQESLIEMEAPPIELIEPDAQEPTWNPILASVYASASRPLSEPQ